MWIRCIKCLLQPRYELSLFHTHTHTYPLAVATLEDGGSVVVPGVTGSAWAETTNRCNQLSWDSSHCCHAHYSWTNTYIKQPGATGPGTTLGYTHTGSHILNINATHTQLHALFVVTHTHCISKDPSHRPLGMTTTEQSHHLQTRGWFTYIRLSSFSILSFLRWGITSEMCFLHSHAPCTTP